MARTPKPAAAVPPPAEAVAGDAGDGTITPPATTGPTLGTATTPTAPLGRPVVQQTPLVEQIAEDGDGALEVARPAADLINDTEWLFAQVSHRIGCPMITAPFQGTSEQPGRAQRMDRTDATEPRRQDNPMPRTWRVMQCLDCGARARVRLPRDD